MTNLIEIFHPSLMNVQHQSLSSTQNVYDAYSISSNSINYEIRTITQIMASVRHQE